MPHITLSFNWVTTDIRHFGVAICTFHLGFSFSITTTLPQFAQFLVGNRSAGGKATRLASARGQVAMEMCSRSFYCEPSL